MTKCSWLGYARNLASDNLVTSQTQITNDIIEYTFAASPSPMRYYKSAVELFICSETYNL